MLYHMVNSSSFKGLDATFSALSDPTRRAILAHLQRGEASVGDVAALFEWSLPAVSKHIRVLEATGLIVRRVEGRTHYLSLAAHPLREAAEWLGAYQGFWVENLDALETFLEDEEGA
jgi:DNA-binding transcriptional ArsR family regulator